MPREIGTLRKRGGIWFCRYSHAGGRHEESTGTGDRRVADAWLAQLRRDIRDGSWRAPHLRAAARRIELARAEYEAAVAAAPELAPAPLLTTRGYLEGWVERRKQADVRKAHDEGQLFAVHVYPRIGEKPLVDVDRADMKAIVAAALEHVSPATEKKLAPRTVLHVYRTLATAFGDAVVDKLLAATPCTLRTRKGELPKKRDADPTWRSQSVFRRDELELLAGDPRVALDRRVYYALLGLAGLRSSEAAAITWSSYDTTLRPLGRLLVATQAEDGETTRETKTADVREVPVHPVLAELLERWRGAGIGRGADETFPFLFGRHPRPADPIVPSRASTPDRMRMRSKKMLERLDEDLAMLEVREIPSARHALRASFVTLLEADGANPAIVRRTTHAVPADVDARAGYVRPSWEQLCAEVGKLQITPRRAAKVTSIARSA